MWKPIGYLALMCAVFIAMLITLSLVGLENNNNPPAVAAGASTSATTTGGATSQPPAQGSPAGTAQAGVLTITTPSDIHFDKTELTVAAGAKVTVRYTNDSPIPHNIDFYNGQNANAPSLGMTPIGPGPNDVQTVTFTAPSSPGSYYFQCDVHTTQMDGKLIVH